MHLHDDDTNQRDTHSAMQASEMDVLHIAAEDIHDQSAEALMNAKLFSPHTTLHLAAMDEHKSTIGSLLLLEVGANPLKKGY